MQKYVTGTVLMLSTNGRFSFSAYVTSVTRSKDCKPYLPYWLIDLVVVAANGATFPFDLPMSELAN
jgi:hypothetical protein